MIKVMKNTAIYSLIATLIFLALTIFLDRKIFLPFTITFATIFYHFVIRLAVGYTIDGIFKNNIDYNKKWFAPLRFEEKLYNKLGVKKWKDKMPTAVPKSFDLSDRDYYRVARVTCQAEIVHEINVLLSFIPLLAAIWFGDFWVFFITSLLGAGYDLIFVILQRYNRPRILKIAEKANKKQT